MARPATRRLRSAVSALLTACALGLAGAVLVPALLGLERYVLTSGSMAGSYGTGSIVYARAVPVADLRVGDVITYTPPADVGPPAPAGLVTHRIVSIERRSDGARQFRTKGDANAAADPWRFTLRAPTQARVSFGLPLLGYGLAALSDRTLRMLLIGVPALLVAAGALAGLWRDAGRETRRAAS
jgi:signal peptidase I